MVASSLLGVSSKYTTFFDFLDPDFNKSLTCCVLIEKKAISEPDTKAEKNNSNATIAKPIIISNENGLKSVLIINKKPEYGSALRSSKVC
jgi:hypothetical protein